MQRWSAWTQAPRPGRCCLWEPEILTLPAASATILTRRCCSSVRRQPMHVRIGPDLFASAINGGDGDDGACRRGRVRTRLRLGLRLLRGQARHLRPALLLPLLLDEDLPRRRLLEPLRARVAADAR